MGRVGPPGVGGAGGDAENVGTLIERQAAETPQLDEIGQSGMLGGEPGEGLVERLQVAVGRITDQVARFKLDAFSPAAFGGVLGAGVIDQDAAHALGRGLQIVAPRRERSLATELQVRSCE